MSTDTTFIAMTSPYTKHVSWQEPHCHENNTYTCIHHVSWDKPHCYENTRYTARTLIWTSLSWNHKIQSTCLVDMNLIAMADTIHSTCHERHERHCYASIRYMACSDRNLIVMTIQIRCTACILTWSAITAKTTQDTQHFSGHEHRLLSWQHLIHITCPNHCHDNTCPNMSIIAMPEPDTNACLDMNLIAIAPPKSKHASWNELQSFPCHHQI